VSIRWRSTAFSIGFAILMLKGGRRETRATFRRFAARCSAARRARAPSGPNLYLAESGICEFSLSSQTAVWGRVTRCCSISGIWKGADERHGIRPLGIRAERVHGLKRKPPCEQPARNVSPGRIPGLRIPCLWGVAIASDNRT
jgi:hypothetical protein